MRGTADPDYLDRLFFALAADVHGRGMLDA